MTEQHQRCRFWPHCEVHQGAPADWKPGMTVYTEAEVQEMRRQRAAGWTYAEIAQDWGTTTQYAWHLLTQTRRGALS